MTPATHEHQHRHHTNNVDERQRSRTAEEAGREVTRLTPISASERRQRPLCGLLAGRRGGAGLLRALSLLATPAPPIRACNGETFAFLTEPA